MVVSALAEVLDLPVLPRRLAVLQIGTPTDDRGDELADLLEASVGVNLAFPMLENARDASADDLAGFTPIDRAAILWLDRFVLNPDRTIRNPNILRDEGKLYLIDHGSALRFQYNWPQVTEAMPREVGATSGPHIFEAASASNEWADLDIVFASRVTRATLEDALAAVPATFLAPLRSKTERRDAEVTREAAIQRRRAAYVAFLWKRLQPPRAFANEPPVLLSAS
jgi:hypothetical protein